MARLTEAEVSDSARAFLEAVSVAPEVLDFYSHRSKIFMAARFDAARNIVPVAATAGLPGRSSSARQCLVIATCPNPI